MNNKKFKLMLDFIPLFIAIIVMLNYISPSNYKIMIIPSIMCIIIGMLLFTIYYRDNEKVCRVLSKITVGIILIPFVFLSSYSLYLSANNGDWGMVIFSAIFISILSFIAYIIFIKR